MSGSLSRGGGENVPGIPGACATRNFTYLARGSCHDVIISRIVHLQVFPYWVLLCICGTILSSIALMNGIYMLILRKALQITKQVSGVYVNDLVIMQALISQNWAGIGPRLACC